MSQGDNPKVRQTAHTSSQRGKNRAPEEDSSSEEEEEPPKEAKKASPKVATKIATSNAVAEATVAPVSPAPSRLEQSCLLSPQARPRPMVGGASSRFGCCAAGTGGPRLHTDDVLGQVCVGRRISPARVPHVRWDRPWWPTCGNQPETMLAAESSSKPSAARSTSTSVARSESLTRDSLAIPPPG